MYKFDPEKAARLERHERYALIPPEATLRRCGVRSDKAGHFVVHEQGHLNPSHYYSVLSVAHAEATGELRVRIPDEDVASI